MSEQGDRRIEIIARGVCAVGGKVLLCRPKGGGYSYLPGGHVEFGETSRTALVREMAEETGQVAKVGELLGVVESQFDQGGQHHCEVSLVYRMETEPAIDPGRPVESREGWIEFVWCPLDRLDEANMLPAEMRGCVR